MGDPLDWPYFLTDIIYQFLISIFFYKYHTQNSYIEKGFQAKFAFIQAEWKEYHVNLETWKKTCKTWSTQLERQS